MSNKHSAVRYGRPARRSYRPRRPHRAHRRKTSRRAGHPASRTGMSNKHSAVGCGRRARRSRRPTRRPLRPTARGSPDSPSRPWKPNRPQRRKATRRAGYPASRTGVSNKHSAVRYGRRDRRLYRPRRPRRAQRRRATRRTGHPASRTGMSNKHSAVGYAHRARPRPPPAAGQARRNAAFSDSGARACSTASMLAPMTAAFSAATDCTIDRYSVARGVERV